jgi:hypothetical protein
MSPDRCASSPVVGSVGVVTLTLVVEDVAGEGVADELLPQCPPEQHAAAFTVVAFTGLPLGERQESANLWLHGRDGAPTDDESPRVAL